MYGSESFARQQLSDRLPPRNLLTLGFAALAAGVLWFITLATPRGSIPLMCVMSVVCGIASSCIWAPLPATALRNLPLRQLGAASGVYNTTRQVGSVLGSAGIGVPLTARMTAHSVPTAEPGHLPASLKAPYASALTGTLYLTVALLVIRAVAAAFLTPIGTALGSASPPPVLTRKAAA
ncbi:MFS transporter [Nocardia sp. NBC_01388]|uniref:MFS transporter n=1 Tax=Nocardia sp. NBC_01388 TaxID=2903596 RepID=UPI00324D8AB7